MPLNRMNEGFCMCTTFLYANTGFPLSMLILEVYARQARHSKPLLKERDRTQRAVRSALCIAPSSVRNKCEKLFVV